MRPEQQAKELRSIADGLLDMQARAGSLARRALAVAEQIESATQPREPEPAPGAETE